MMKRRSDQATKRRRGGNAHSSPSSLRRSVAPSLASSAFTVIEVLFAVVILGIGFIMLAAMFPVAIQQGRQNSAESTAASIARGGVNYLERTLNTNLLPGTGLAGKPGSVFSFRDPRLSAAASSALWDAVKGNLIVASDPRTAWVPLYRRDVDAAGALSPYAQILVLTLQVRGRGTYSGADLAANPATLQPRPVLVTMIDGLPDMITLSDVTNSAHAALGPASDPIDAFKAAATDAYIVISDDRATGKLNGHVFRLGNFVTSTPASSTWELAPGNDLSSAAQNVSGAIGFVIGRGLTNPAAPYSAASNDYSGMAQDVSVYTTFIKVQ